MPQLTVTIDWAQRNEVPGRQGWQGAVLIAPNTTLYVSRLDGESAWTVDARMQGSLPVFVNGYGARYLRTDVIADADVIAQLEAIAGAPNNGDGVWTAA